MKIVAKFSFSEVNVADIRLEIKNAGAFMGIPAKHLKQTIDIICEYLEYSNSSK